MSDDIKYEYKSVQAVRGMENHSMAKVQKEGGWELIDQTKGTLRTTLNFRRVKPQTSLSKAWDAFRGLAPAKQRALTVAVAVFLPLAAVGIGIAAAQDEGGTNAESVATKPTESVTVNETPSPLPAPTVTEKTNQVITPENNKELAALLVAGDYCDPSMAKFATKYQGQEIQFDGSVAIIEHHANYDTRYDILLGPGNEGPNTTVGPAFKYNNVNMFDLHFTGKSTTSYVTDGDKFRFTAEVGEYNPTQCLFSLNPVSTSGR